MSKILTLLALRPASLAQVEAITSDGGGEERQPPPRKFVLADKRRAPQNSVSSTQKLAVWTGQEPGERIANTLLLCAIRDRAHQVTLTPSAKGVEVRFQIESGVREQKLPAFALAPIVEHFKTLASDAAQGTSNGELSGQARIAVDEQFYEVRFSPLPTQWGAGVKVQLSPRQ